MRALLVASVLLLALPSRAQESVVVFEAWANERPDDAPALIAPLLAELAKHGYTSGAPLGEVIREKVTREGRALSEDEVSRASRLVNDGYEAYLRGRFEEAVKKLEAALALYRSGPATIARDQGHRNALHKALVGLAMANKRLGEPEAATRAMVELVLGFPDRGVERSLYGPEPVELYFKVKGELDERGRGVLRIQVDDPAAVIFVNERYVSVGQAALPDAPPGRYRVFVQKGPVPGRVHEVLLPPRGEIDLSISFRRDAALRSGDFAGFVYADDATLRQHADEDAVAVAGALGAGGLIVVGGFRENGRRALYGKVLSLDTGKVVRSAMLSLEPVLPSPAQIRGLARFLSGGEPGPGLVVTVSDAQAPADLPGTRRPLRVWKWLALTAGVVGLAAGGYLVSLDGEGTCDKLPGQIECPETYETLWPGIGVGVAGAALVTAGIVLWLKDDPGEDGVSSGSVSVSPDGAFVWIGGRF